MAYQRNILFELDAHHAFNYFPGFIAPELNAFPDLRLKFCNGHIGLMPKVSWNDAFVGIGAVINNIVNSCYITGIAWDDHMIVVASKLFTLALQCYIIFFTRRCRDLVSRFL